MSRPSRRKNGCGSMVTVIIASPSWPPAAPLSRQPFQRIACVSRALALWYALGARCIARTRICVTVDLAAVIVTPLDRIAKDFIGRAQILEASAFVGRAFGRVGVETFRQRAKRLFDFLVGCG